MPRKKHYIFYDDQFKATAVALTNIPGALVREVAQVLDIHEVMLYRWRMEMRRGEIVTKKKSAQLDPEMKSELKRLRKLEREHADLKEENEILKKFERYTSNLKKTSSPSSK